MIRQAIGQLIKRRSSDQRYWARRSERLGAAAVCNIAHADAGIATITEKQKLLLYPLLRRELHGDERAALDVGCGSGRFTPDLAELLQGTSIGIDPVPTLLALAPQAESVTYLGMKPGRIPLIDASVDLAWIVLVLGGITNNRVLRRTVDEVCRVLRPGGLLFLAENTARKPHARHWRFYDPQWYVDLFPEVALSMIGSYEDVGEVITVFAGRRRIEST